MISPGSTKNETDGTHCPRPLAGGWDGFDPDGENVINRARLYRDRRDFVIQPGDTGKPKDYPTSPAHQNPAWARPAATSANSRTRGYRHHLRSGDRARDRRRRSLASNPKHSLQRLSQGIDIRVCLPLTTTRVPDNWSKRNRADTLQLFGQLLG